MNKKLLTVAIGAALAAGPMLASADVKLFGKVHVSVDYLDAKDAGTLGVNGRKATTVSSNASRWGLDISEKLGGGMTAIAKLEQTIMADGESSSQDTRNRYVGMKGKFGQIIAGIHDTPLKDISRTVELFPEYIGDNRNIFGDTIGGSGVNTTRGWDLRPANAIKYSTPAMNGFVAEYLYSADAVSNTAKEDNSNRLWSLGLKYSKGPLYVAYARESHRFNNIPTGGTTSETGDRLGASYNFGAFKLVGLYQSLSDLGGTDKDAGDSSVKRKSWMLGGAYTAGNNVFKLQYAKADDLSNNSVGASAPETGAKMWALGWDHLFSKTTKAYIAYAKTDNGSSAAFKVNGPSGGVHSDSIAPATGANPSAWSVGMIVDF